MLSKIFVLDCGNKTLDSGQKEMNDFLESCESVRFVTQSICRSADRKYLTICTTVFYENEAK